MDCFHDYSRRLPSVASTRPCHLTDLLCLFLRLPLRPDRLVALFPSPLAEIDSGFPIRYEAGK